MEYQNYEIKQTKIKNLINDDLEPSSSVDETGNESDSQSHNDYDDEPDNELFDKESQN